MHFKLKVFAGMRPQRDPDLLVPGEAVFAQNVKLSGGDLEPFRGLTQPGVTFAGGTVKSIYRFGQSSTSETQYWFQSTTDADYVRGAVDGDTTERTYWTDGVYPKKTNAALGISGAPYPSASYRIGIPAPATVMAVTVSGTPTSSSDPVQTILYCETYVSAWGEEGPPGPLSNSVGFQGGQTMSLTNLSVAPTGAYNIVGKRLYRSATGTAATAFQLVNTVSDIPIATTTYSDSNLTSALGDTLITTGWSEPPDGMIGLTQMANGIMAGFMGNTLYFSEPYLPYAWPPRYQLSCDAPVVGIAAFDQSLFVGTTQGVYIVTGSDPATLTQEKLPVQQSCVSKRSVVGMLGGVFFASPDGLMKITAAGIQNLSEDLMSRVEWQAYTPSSITAFESDNNYLAFFDTGSRQGGMVFTFGSAPTFSETSIFPTAGYRDRQRDALYLAIGNVLNRWDAGGTPLTYDWLSGVFHFPTYTNMAAARVDAYTYPVTFKLYSDDVLRFTKTVTSKYPFRLPAYGRSTRFQIELTGTSAIREVAVGDSVLELTIDG